MCMMCLRTASTNFILYIQVCMVNRIKCMSFCLSIVLPLFKCMSKFVCIQTFTNSFTCMPWQISAPTTVFYIPCFPYVLLYCVSVYVYTNFLETKLNQLSKVIFVPIFSERPITNWYSGNSIKGGFFVTVEIFQQRLSPV